MTVKMRLPQSLLERVRTDLSRQHPFAGERVGFLYARLAKADVPLVLATGYEPLADDRYIDDPSSGARIDSLAIRNAMQGVLDRDQGAFHVHMHAWPGRPLLSWMDKEEIPRVVTAFRRVGPSHAHGILLLNDEECAAWVWLPGADDPVEASSLSIVGSPLRAFHRRNA